MRYAVVVASIVENLILLEHEADYTPPAGYLVAVGDWPVDIGWLHNGESFFPPSRDEEKHRPTKARFGDLFTDDQHGRMNLIRWQCSQMDAADRAVPGNPLVYAETLFRKFDLPAEFIEMDLPMVADGLGLLGMLGVFGDDAETEIPRILRNELPS